MWHGQGYTSTKEFLGCKWIRSCCESRGIYDDFKIHLFYHSSVFAEPLELLIRLIPLENSLEAGLTTYHRAVGL